MVGSIRSALILLAACANVPVVIAIAQPPAAKLDAELALPFLQVPDIVLVPLDEEPLVTDVVFQLGPSRDPILTPEARDRLVAQLPHLTGNPRLVALDRLAAARDAALDTSDDDPQLARKAYADAIAAPGFAKYPHAADVLFRAARLELEHDAFDAGSALVAQLLANYPRSPWISDAQVLAASYDPDFSDALRYLDDAIANGRPSLIDYARYVELDVLVRAGKDDQAFAVASELARNDLYRAPATLRILIPLQFLDYDEALKRLADLDPEDLPAMILRFADLLGQARTSRALRVFTNELSATSEPMRRCRILTSMLRVADHEHDRDQIMQSAAQLADLALEEPRCRPHGEVSIARQAWMFTQWFKPQTPAHRDAEALWRLAARVSTDPARKMIELRNLALIEWELARTAADWWATASAFDAAALANPSLAPIAERARHNAQLLK